MTTTGIEFLKGFIEDFGERIDNLIEEEDDPDNGYLQHYCHGMKQAKALVLGEMLKEYKKNWVDDQTHAEIAERNILDAVRELGKAKNDKEHRDRTLEVLTQLRALQTIEQGND